MRNAGFSQSEMERLSGCLARLMSHVHRDEVAITGGVAIQIGLAALGRAGSRPMITDLDLVASRLDSIAASVAGPFLVSHYHVPQADAPKFMVQLVDPVSHIRVDIFPDLVGSLQRAKGWVIGNQLVNVLPLESVFDHKLLTIAAASETKPVDPKHDADARALGAFFGRKVPLVRGGALIKDVYGIEADVVCQRCDSSRHPRFPLAPKDQIFDLLGWTYAQRDMRLQPPALGAIVKRHG